MANKKRFANASVLAIIVIVVFICSALVSVFLWHEPEPEQENSKLEQEPILAQIELTRLSPEKTAQLVIKNEVLSEKEQEPSFEQQIIEVPVVVSASTPLALTDELGVDKVGIVVQNAVTQERKKVDGLMVRAPIVKQAKVEVIKEKNTEGSIVSVLNVQDDRQWVLAQKKQQYTLQLIVLSAKDKLLEEQKKYLRLGVKTFYIERQAKQSKTYILFHGVFASIDEAKKKMKKLPKALQKSWPRVFSAIQKDL